MLSSPHTGHKLCCLKPRHSSKLGRPQLCLKIEYFLKAWQFQDLVQSYFMWESCFSSTRLHLARNNFTEKVSPVLVEVKDDPILASFRLLGWKSQAGVRIIMSQCVTLQWRWTDTPTLLGKCPKGLWSIGKIHGIVYSGNYQVTLVDKLGQSVWEIKQGLH